MKLDSKILPWLAAIFVVAVWAETFVSSKLVLNNGMMPAGRCISWPRIQP